MKEKNKLKIRENISNLTQEFERCCCCGKYIYNPSIKFEYNAIGGKKIMYICPSCQKKYTKFKNK